MVCGAAVTKPPRASEAEVASVRYSLADVLPSASPPPGHCFGLFEMGVERDDVERTGVMSTLSARTTKGISEEVEPLGLVGRTKMEGTAPISGYYFGLSL